MSAGDYMQVHCMMHIPSYNALWLVVTDGIYLEKEYILELQRLGESRLI